MKSPHERTSGSGSDPLFFIAVVPPPAIGAEISAFKRYVRDIWGSGHALKSPPHITLIPPFRFPEPELPRFCRLLSAFAQEQTAFDLELRNFDAFSPRVIFACPMPNPQLEQLFLDLKQLLESRFGRNDARNDRPFKPHLTIAHRDLEEAAFRKAWPFFKHKTYERTFRVDALVLLRHAGGKWTVFQRFPFGKS